jgi:hypothetical protein
MGRPLNKKYFGNRNIGTNGGYTADDGIGGEGVASVTITQGTGKTNGSKTVTFSAPELPGGVTATATGSVAGGVLTITMTNKGSGYVAAPTVTVTGGGTGWSYVAVLTTDSGAPGSATNQENAIIVYAQTTSGGSRVIGDIIKQTNGRSYKVRTADGTAVCKLRTDGLSGFGTCDITAIDSAGGEYWVLKLTAHKAVLVVKGVGGGTQFATGQSVPWTLGNAVLNYSVKIQNA